MEEKFEDIKVVGVDWERTRGLSEQQKRPAKTPLHVSWERFQRIALKLNHAPSTEWVRLFKEDPSFQQLYITDVRPDEALIVGSWDESRIERYSENLRVVIASVNDRYRSLVEARRRTQEAEDKYWQDLRDRLEGKLKFD